MTEKKEKLTVKPTLRKEVVDVLMDELAPKLGLMVLRPEDKRRQKSIAIAIEKLILWARGRLPAERPTIEAAEERALLRELEQVRL